MTPSQFSNLYDENYGTLFYWILGKIGNRQAAEDAVSDTFRLAWEHRDQLKEIECAQGWLYAIAESQRKIYWRVKIRRGRHWVDLERPEDIADPHDFTDALARRMEVERLRRLMDSIPSPLLRRALRNWCHRKPERTAAERTRVFNAKRELEALCQTSPT